MSRTWSAYFDETHSKDYYFLDFYEYRLQQSDFTFSFQKESDKLKKDLGSLITNGSDKMKEGASLLNKSFKAKFFFIIFCMASWQREASIAVDNCLLSTLWFDYLLWKKENPYNYGRQLLAIYLVCCACL